MKRDLDLIRALMLEAEAQPAGRQFHGGVFRREGRDATELAEHLVLLIEHRLLDARVYSSFDCLAPDHIQINRVTWKGHEFLDAVREDTIWKKVKVRLADVGGNATVEVVTQLGAAITKQMLGLG